MTILSIATKIIFIWFTYGQRTYVGTPIDMMLVL